MPGVDGETTVGRVLFNAVLPLELRFLNKAMDRSAIRKVPNPNPEPEPAPMPPQPGPPPTPQPGPKVRSRPA